MGGAGSLGGAGINGHAGAPNRCPLAGRSWIVLHSVGAEWCSGIAASVRCCRGEYWTESPLGQGRGNSCVSHGLPHDSNVLSGTPQVAEAVADSTLRVSPWVLQREALEKQRAKRDHTHADHRRQLGGGTNQSEGTRRSDFPIPHTHPAFVQATHARAHAGACTTRTPGSQRQRRSDTGLSRAIAADEGQGDAPTCWHYMSPREE